MTEGENSNRVTKKAEFSFFLLAHVISRFLCPWHFYALANLLSEQVFTYLKPVSPNLYFLSRSHWEYFRKCLFFFLVFFNFRPDAPRGRK